MFVKGERLFGVRRLKEFDLSLLGKLVWRVLEEREGFWYKVLCVRYVEVVGRLRFGGGGKFGVFEEFEKCQGGGRYARSWVLV